MVLLGIGVWAIGRIAAAPEGYREPPGCAAAEGEVLTELVPDARADVSSPLDSLNGSGRTGVQCRWATTEDARRTPAAARVVMVVTGDDAGRGAGGAAELLAGASQRHERTALSGLGDSAYSWYDGEVRPLGWGCVAFTTANLFVESCYSAAGDFAGTRPIPDADMVDGAKRLAHSVLASAEAGRD
ncbi:hypothetical protein [Nocardiopsis coralliicola]